MADNNQESVFAEHRLIEGVISMIERVPDGTLPDDIINRVVAYFMEYDYRR